MKTHSIDVIITLNAHDAWPPKCQWLDFLTAAEKHVDAIWSVFIKHSHRYGLSTWNVGQWPTKPMDQCNHWQQRLVAVFTSRC